MTSGPLDQPRPRPTPLSPRSTRPEPVTHTQAPPPVGVTRAERGAIALLALGGRVGRVRELAQALTGRMPGAGSRSGLSYHPRNPARGTDADPSSVCLLGGPYPLVGSPNSIRAGSR
jgi:hypothetical protein